MKRELSDGSGSNAHFHKNSHSSLPTAVQVVVLMEITAATTIHIPDIVELWKEFMDFHRDCDPFFARTKDAHTAFEMYVREQMTSEEAQVLVAVDGDHVIAYSISQILKYPPIYHDETYGFISDIAVNSAYQRQGIGEAMLHLIFEWFRSRNIRRIELQVAAKNQVGYSFWRKNEFEDYIHILYLKREETDSFTSHKGKRTER